MGGMNKSNQVERRATSMKHDQRSTTEFDRLIGQRLKKLRLAKGLTQDGLGKRIGISFQQIQKYENGSNRISASRLNEIASKLDVPVTFFFSQDEMQATELATNDVADQVIRVARELSEIPEGPIRDQLFNLIKTIRRNPNRVSVN